MANAAPNANQPSGELSKRFVLWVDGAEGALVLLGEEITLGGFRPDPNRADVCLMANLARKHLTITRAQGRYELQTHQSITLKDHPFPTDPGERITLDQQSEWKMDQDVEIRFRLPTVLSQTAVLDFPGSARPITGQPPVTVDQVILMDQNCLIGPGNGQHIRLTNSEDGVILYRSKQQLFCKAKTPFSKNEEPLKTSVSLQPGDTITGRDFRFRLENLEAF